MEILSTQDRALLTRMTRLRQIREAGFHAVHDVFSGRVGEIVIVHRIREDAAEAAARIRLAIHGSRPIQFARIFGDLEEPPNERPAEVVARFIEASRSLSEPGGHTVAIRFRGSWGTVFLTKDRRLDCNIFPDSSVDYFAAQVMALATAQFQCVGTRTVRGWAQVDTDDEAESILTYLRDQDEPGQIPWEDFPDTLARTLSEAFRATGCSSSEGRIIVLKEGLPNPVTFVQSTDGRGAHQVRIETDGAYGAVHLIEFKSQPAIPQT
jgi:hypothetical protein